MPSELALERDGVRLAALDYGGDGPSVLLLHGLAGYAGEWAETAGWLTESCRVVALDARGHGGSERLPPDVSPGAHVADAEFAVERLGLGPVVVVGQSLGGGRPCSSRPGARISFAAWSSPTPARPAVTTPTPWRSTSRRSGSRCGVGRCRSRHATRPLSSSVVRR